MKTATQTFIEQATALNYPETSKELIQIINTCEQQNLKDFDELEATIFNNDIKEIIKKEIPSDSQYWLNIQTFQWKLLTYFYTHDITSTSALTRTQTKTLTKQIDLGKNDRGNKVTGHINVKIRYDDDCNNGHNSFSITGDIYSTPNSNRECYLLSSGCIHDEIIKYFPELAHLIKYHLMSSEAPMYYFENTLYHVRDREITHLSIDAPINPSKYHKSILRFHDLPIRIAAKGLDWINKLTQKDIKNLEIIEVSHEKEPQTFTPRFTFKGHTDQWYKCLFDTKVEAEEMLNLYQSTNWYIETIPTKFNKACKPNLQAGRNSAVWEDATLEQLQNPAELVKHLRSLLIEFKTEIEKLGFIY